jgi:Double zinc ribbon
MHAKKKLISKLAFGTGTVLLVAAVSGVFGLLLDSRDRWRRTDRLERDNQERIESSRSYLAEVAKRVNKLPVDPTLAGEVESRYFEEQANGPFYLWALDTKGDFAFGVPQSAFRKLNALYDREVTPRLKEGVLLDRQTFLLSLVDNSDDIDPTEVSEGRAAEIVERGRRWRPDRNEPSSPFVLSTPLKGADGSALGSLYLKRSPLRRDRGYHPDERVEALLVGSAVVGALSFVFLWVLLPTWVYVDARERGVRRAPLFAFLTVLSSLVGLVVYLIARPEDGRTLACPGCAREVNGGAFCPHCGRDLSSSFCPACRYPLKPDWVFCPACRTEIKASSGAGAPVPEAG